MHKIWNGSRSHGTSEVLPISSRTNYSKLKIKLTNLNWLMFLFILKNRMPNDLIVFKLRIHRQKQDLCFVFFTPNEFWRIAKIRKIKVDHQSYNIEQVSCYSSQTAALKIEWDIVIVCREMIEERTGETGLVQCTEKRHLASLFVLLWHSIFAAKISNLRSKTQFSNLRQ